MSILQLPTPLAGQEGLRPATKKMVCTDAIGNVISPGYLNAVTLESYSVSNTDVIEIVYKGGMGLFTPSITTKGVITLNPVTSFGGIQTNAISTFQSGSGIVTAKQALTATDAGPGMAAVTINQQSGVINTDDFFIDAGGTFQVDMTNSFVTPSSVFITNPQGGTFTTSNYTISSVVGNGVALISITYQGIGTGQGGTIIFGFIVL